MPDAKEQFKEWLDEDVIAEAVLSQLEQNQPELATLENAKIVWLDVLENLGELIDQAIQYKLHEV